MTPLPRHEIYFQKALNLADGFARMKLGKVAICFKAHKGSPRPDGSLSGASCIFAAMQDLRKKNLRKSDKITIM